MKFEEVSFRRDPDAAPTVEPRFRQKIDRAVFDRGHGHSGNPETRIGLGGGSNSIVLRRTARDAQPPRSVVTAILMGDPPPDRPKW